MCELDSLVSCDVLGFSRQKRDRFLSIKIEIEKEVKWTDVIEIRNRVS